MPDAPPIHEHKPVAPPWLRLLAFQHDHFDAGMNLNFVRWLHNSRRKCSVSSLSKVI